MVLVDGMHAGHTRVVGRMSGDAAAYLECEVKTLMTPDHTGVHLRNSG